VKCLTLSLCNVLVCASCALLTSEILASDVDPIENVNRKTHGFNDVADRFLLKPLAKGYDKVTPTFARKGIRNFFYNIGDVNVLVNDLFQGKLKAALSDSGRLLVNTTIGIGGLFDPASSLGLVRHEEDWGQTLAKWHVGQGPYFVLPLFGPSTLRDAISLPIDAVFNPVLWLNPVRHRNPLYGFQKIHQRAELLSAESLVFGDRYLFLRDAYLQRREFLINDGEVEDLFDDDF